MTKIEYKTGDLLDVKEGVIIHGCNMQGVMGAGVAKAIKEKYPECFKEYQTKLFLEEDCVIGTPIRFSVNKNLVIENLLTQETYGRSIMRYVSYDAIDIGFAMLNSRYNDDKVFHFPKIGAGLGGGNWNIISKIIEKTCSKRKLICWTL